MVARLALCILLFMIAGCDQFVAGDQAEIQSYQYQNVETIVEDHPELRSLVKKMLSDNKITVAEYKQIIDTREDLWQRQDREHVKQIISDLKS